MKDEPIEAWPLSERLVADGWTHEELKSLAAMASKEIERLDGRLHDAEAMIAGDGALVFALRLQLLTAERERTAAMEGWRDAHQRMLALEALAKGQNGVCDSLGGCVGCGAIGVCVGVQLTQER